MSQANPHILVSLLAQVAIVVDTAVVAQWDEQQQEQAEDWAIRKNLQAKSPTLYVPAMPDFLQPYVRHAA